MMSEISATLPPGLCPICEASGPVGSPCAERICERQGLAFIPEADARAALAMAAGDREGLIGRYVGDFLITRRLGKGGFGRVLLGLQRPLFKLKSAVKLLEFHGGDTSLNEALSRKFESEAAALAVLHSPHVVRLLQFGTFDGRPFMAMEFVPGGRTLRNLAGLPGDTAVTTLPHDTSQRIIADTLSGLEAAHAQGIIHRDIKPDNLMLQDVVGNPLFVKIVDFGLAKSLAAHTETSHVFGTVQYMAPEQIERGQLGPWTDLYAVAVMAFELLLGRRPYKGPDSQSIMLEKLNPLFDPLSNVKPGELEPEGESFFRRALARDPAHRFQSAAAFRSAWLELFGIPASKPAPTRSPVSLIGAPPAPDTPPGRAASTSSGGLHLVLTEAADVERAGDAPLEPTGGSRRRSDGYPPSTALELQPTPGSNALSVQTGAPPELLRAAKPPARPRWPLIAGLSLSGLGVATTVLIVAALQQPGPAPEFARPSDELDTAMAPAPDKPGTIPASQKNPRGAASPPAVNADVAASPPATTGTSDAPAEPKDTPDPIAAAPLDVETAREADGARSAAEAVVIAITSHPAGASVSVDGEAVGRTPFSLHTEVGRSHELRIEAAGHKPSERTLMTVSGMEDIHVTLEQERTRRGTSTRRRPRAATPSPAPPSPSETDPPPEPGPLTPIYIDE